MLGLGAGQACGVVQLLVRSALLHVKNKQMCVSWGKSCGKEKQQPFLRVNLSSDSDAPGLGLVSSPSTFPLQILKHKML